MWKIPAFLTRNLVTVIPAMMVLGFLYGLACDAQPLKSLVMPFTFLMVYPMMINLKIKKVFEGGDTKSQVITMLLNFLVMPFVALAVAKAAFGGQPYMALGLVLASLLPTSGMTISYTGLSRGNMEAAIKMTVIGLTLGSLAAPFYVKWFLGAQIAIDVASVMQTIALIVFLPMVAGYVTQQAVLKKVGPKAFKDVWSPRFPALSTVGVVGVVFVAMALKAHAIAAKPAILPAILVPLAIVYAANYAISIAVGKLTLGRDDAIALLYGSVMRNLSIALAVTMNAFGAQGSEAALVISLAYILQVQSAAWFVKYTDKIFGPKAELKEAVA